MDITYKVRGADGKEYGPVTLDQLTGWIREGRIGSQGEVMRSDTDYWARVADFEELKGALPAAPPPLTQTAQVSTGAKAGYASQVRTGASWFYSVAGLSVINTILSVCNAPIRFIFGLGVTEIFSVVGNGVGGAGKFVALIASVIAGAVLVFFGVFASKGQTWAFAVGIAIYALDAVLVLVAGDWLGGLFHAYVIFRLVQGMMACRQLNAR